MIEQLFNSIIVSSGDLSSITVSLGAK